MGQGILQIVLFVAILIAAAYPLGLYMARVYTDDDFLRRGRLRFLGSIERGFYRLVGDRAAREQTWKRTARRCSSSASSSSSSCTRSSDCRGICS